MGIPAEDLEHIFDEFYRVNSPEREKIGGTGLGLAIVRTVVERHNGHMEVNSVEDQGTTFTVYLPH